MRLINNLRKYMPYAKTTALAELKSQVAESYLGWLWWILDPLLFMLVYTFIVEVVFGTSTENFPLYVFIGLILWNMFAGTVTASVGIVRSYRSVFLKAYIPKYMIIIVQLMVNGIKMLIGLGVAFVIILILGINITINLLNLLPILFVYSLFTFGVSLFCAHVGVFVADFENVMVVLIRLLFYLSGIFYTLERLPQFVKQIYYYVCPTGFILEQCRNSMMYGMPVNYLVLGFWFVISIILILTGVKLMDKYENTYIKVI